ncbi:probable phosphoglycerate mutase [Peptoclostridium litorale DSM 5388]|uniref:Phosphoserine phosphatase 1 n=1 Tax=Peptoclostridium litorale DSM 5388 TaxID=1121324 RepID=A0A069RG73_PEPLI|nr:phosphoserine phosphatase 1 [Peptoclostridium litorale DSM 5388]SIN74196.1 probable phosphoglycerate mutase [Peptoclostridium litorale DSM 5388]
MKLNKFFIVRHGQTEWNIQKKTQGQQNSSLAEIGIEQTQKLAKRLQSFDVDYIYSSDLGRTIETSNIISSHLDKEIMLDKGLREINFGDWEGLTINAIREKYSDIYKVWRTKPQEAQIPGAENLLQARKRIMDCISNINEQHDNANILLVSHGMIIKILLVSLLGAELSNIYKIKQGNTSLNVIEYRDYGPVIMRVNDTTHLEEK